MTYTILKYSVKSMLSIILTGLFLSSANIVVGFQMDHDLSNSQASFLGEDSGDYAGISISSAGDVNGDGFDDIIIGADRDESAGASTGQVYLIFGKKTGWQFDTSLSNADASFRGEKSGDQAGSSVSSAGDVNGDGYDDIIIGAWHNDENGDSSGQTYLILGKENGWVRNQSLSNSDASFIGEKSDDHSGFDISGIGDVNGDGFDDILISSDGYVENVERIGKIYVVFGRPTGWSMDMQISNSNASYIGENENDFAGFAISGAGDVNGDGFNDFIIGAFKNSESGDESGQTYLILGKDSVWSQDISLSQADASFLGEGDDEHSGYRLSGVGDVNGDGYDDFIIGAEGNDEGGDGTGQTYLILGKRTGWETDLSLSNSDASFQGEKIGDRSGTDVSGAGDVNGDGYDDFLIGASKNDDGGDYSGQTYLILGKKDGWIMDQSLSSVDASLIGEDSWDETGRYLSGAGDINDDGFDDILVGAPYDNDVGNQAGQVYLVLYSIRPEPPTNLSKTFSEIGDNIEITWDFSDYWGVISKFNIYRSEDGTNYDLIGSVGPTITSYNDTNVDRFVTYYYYITAMNGPDIESYKSSVMSAFNDKDTDTDGEVDFYDSDDDGDGYSDFSDMFPLNSAEWIDTDLDGIGNNADEDDDNDGIVDLSDLEPLNSHNQIEYMIEFLSTSVNENLSQIQIKLDLVSMLISSINDSIQLEISLLNSEIDGLETTIRSEFEDIMERVSDLGLNLSDEMETISNLLIEIDQESIPEIIDNILDLGVSIDEDNIELNNDLTELHEYLIAFQSKIDDRMQNISSLMATMEQLESLEEDTLSLMQQVSDVDKKQDETAKDLSGKTILIILLLLLVILLILISGFNLFLNLKKNGERQA